MSGLSSAIEGLPLPGGWIGPEVYSDDITMGGLTVFRVGLQARREADGLEVTGSAAALVEAPMDRAYFELYERIALIEATDLSCPLRDPSGHAVGREEVGTRPTPPDRQRTLSRSNGVAFHSTWERACAAAKLELHERHAVLAAWYGERALEPADPPRWIPSIDTHRWRAALVARVGAWEPHVALVVGFPIEPTRPLARGFGAASTGDEALAGAASEAMQNLAFLWDSPVPTRLPAYEPTPSYHLDHYLVPSQHHVLSRWLDGEQPEPDRRPAPVFRETEIRFVDLTPPGAPDGAAVARARASTAHSLFFGELPVDTMGLSRERRIHPIP